MAKDKGGRPLKFKSVKKLEEQIEEYFESCWRQKIDMFGNPVYVKDKKGKKTEEKVLEQFKPYTVSGLAVHLDTSRQTLVNYEKEEGSRKQFFDTIKRAKERIYAFTEEQLFVGKNQSAVIFSLKNNYNWKDKIETDVTSDGRVVGWTYIAPKQDERNQSENKANS